MVIFGGAWGRFSWLISFREFLLGNTSGMLERMHQHLNNQLKKTVRTVPRVCGVLVIILGVFINSFSLINIMFNKISTLNFSNVINGNKGF
jgi:hypothetical protein